MGSAQEYLLSYGCTGEFGRFRTTMALNCRRGDRTVIRTHRGLELGVVLCPATVGHAHFLPNTTVGHLLRLASPADEQAAEEVRRRSEALFEDSRRLAEEFGLPLEVLDAEILLDGEHAILHHVHWAEFDERGLVSGLSRAHGLHVRLHTLRAEAEAEAEEEGCGRENCGRKGGGDCGSGGGCSTCGSCKPADLKAHFAQLREQMEQRRVPLV
jgi:cell fate regulator YaaT (PSP1 superfamily)